MEKVRESLEELESIDPLEWHNIPKPIVQGILCLKSCVRQQTSFLDYLFKHFQDFEGRSNIRILNVQKSLSETLEKLNENDSTTKSAIKHSEQRASENLEQLFKRIHENISREREERINKLEEIKESICCCDKRMDALPTVSQIQGMVNSVSEKVRNKLKQELRESVVNPEIYALTQKMQKQNAEFEGKLIELEIKASDSKAEAEKQYKALQDSVGEDVKAAQELQDRKNNAFLQSIEGLQEQIVNIIEVKIKLEKQTNESISTMNSYKASHTQQIKKFESGLQSCEENIKTLKSNLTNLSRPKSPPRIPTPVSPPPPTPPQVVEFPMEEIIEKIEAARHEILTKVQSDLTSKVQEERSKTFEYINSQVKSVENQSQKYKNVSDHAIEELKDKLAWLPLSLSQLEGMTPGEARLFTIEARLRSEENTRIQTYNHLMHLIEVAMNQKNDLDRLELSRKSPSPLVEKVGIIRNNEKKIPSAQGLEWWKRPQESERRNFSESGSFIAAKMKFSTPMPEMEEGSEYLTFKEKRKTRVVPKSWDIEIAQIPRIQTAIPSKSKNSKMLGKTNKLY